MELTPQSGRENKQKVLHKASKAGSLDPEQLRSRNPKDDEAREIRVLGGGAPKNTARSVTNVYGYLI
jgi:hypothetical protein